MEYLTQWSKISTNCPKLGPKVHPDEHPQGAQLYIHLSLKNASGLPSLRRRSVSKFSLTSRLASRRKRSAMRTASSLQSSSCAIGVLPLSGQSSLYLRDPSGSVQRSRIDFPDGRPMVPAGQASRGFEAYGRYDYMILHALHILQVNTRHYIRYMYYMKIHILHVITCITYP
jgi:hypothetical protein